MNPEDTVQLFCPEHLPLRFEENQRLGRMRACCTQLHRHGRRPNGTRTTQSSTTNTVIATDGVSSLEVYPGIEHASVSAPVGARRSELKGTGSLKNKIRQTNASVGLIHFTEEIIMSNVKALSEKSLHDSNFRYVLVDSLGSGMRLMHIIIVIKSVIILRDRFVD